jgi:lysozyme
MQRRTNGAAARVAPWLAAAALAWPMAAQAIIYCPTNGTVPGVDVSQFQGPVNWGSVAASGVQFAVARAAEGIQLDSTFQQNYQGIAAAGMVRGAYQFFHPGENAVTQANFLLAQMPTVGAGDLAPTLVVEVPDGQSGATILNGINQWASTIRTATGRNPFIYTSAGFWNNTVSATQPAETKLWIAAYGVQCPSLPNGFVTTTLWQYSDSGTIAGISGQVDLDRFYGTRADLLALAGEGVPEPRGWVLLIAGFGGVGALLRRRRSQVTLAA